MPKSNLNPRPNRYTATITHTAYGYRVMFTFRNPPIDEVSHQTFPYLDQARAAAHQWVHGIEEVPSN